MGGLNEAEKKNLINDKICNIYINYSKISNSKKDFINKIEQSLSENERTYLENNAIKKYYNDEIDKFWKKILIDKNKESEMNEKYEKIYKDLLSQHKKEIMKISNSSEQDRKREEKNKLKLQKTVKELQDKIKLIEQKSEEEKTKMENIEKKLEEKLKKKILEERDEKKKTELNEKLKKGKEAKSSYEKEVKIIKSIRYKEIESEFKKNEKDFCKEEISKFDQEKITTFIKKFLKIEKIPKFIVNYLIQLISINKDVVKNIKHLNIILVGPSGVGKSTLIKSILDVDIKTGFGATQTQKIEYFESDKIPFIRLIDSRGIEKDITSGVTITCQKIKDFIKTQIDNRDYDKFIHVIWYCWSGTRLENSEVSLLKELSEQYSLETLPVIIVYTNSVFEEEIEKAKKYVKEELKLNNEFIDVLALEKKAEGKIFKPRNLDCLREKSIELAKSAIKSSVYEVLIKEIKERIQLTIKSLTTELKENINKEAKNYIEKMNENFKIEELYEKTKNIITNVLYKYFILTKDGENMELDKNPVLKCGDVEFSFTKESLLHLDDFTIDYFKEILNSYQNNLEKFLSKYSKELANEITIFKVDFNSRNDNLINDYYSNIQLDVILKDELKEKFSKIAEIAALKNSFISIIEPLIEKIGEYFIELYKQGMGQEKFINFARNSIKVSFDEIEEKIKEFNEKLKEREKHEVENDIAPPPNIQSLTPFEKDVSSLFDDKE